MKQKKTMIICAMATCILSGYAQHQGNTKSELTEKSHELNPVVVTGNGHHEYLKTSTTPVHVMTARQIKSQGVSTLNDALTRLLPNASFMPNAMGTYLRLNGLGNKYILVLVNGKKVIGDIAGNIDLERIDMSRVRRIEVLNGAASSLYGSDAIGGVINIITNQPKDQLLSVQTDTRVSGKGKFTQSANLNFYYKGFGSYTSFKHDEADGYMLNKYQYLNGTEGDTEETVDHQFIGFHTNTISQRFTYDGIKNLSTYAEVSHSYKMLDRARKVEGLDGGVDYNMRFKTLRWNAGASYKFNKNHSLQLDFLSDNFRYGNEYQVDVYTLNKKNKENELTTPKGFYTQTKWQQLFDLELKNINHFTENSTTIFGGEWKNDFLNATTGEVNRHVYNLSAYAQHDLKLFSLLTATLGVRYDKHEAFGNNISPKMALMYAPGDFNIRMNYARGFRAPGMDELYYHYYKAGMGSRGPAITFGNKDLKPEQSDYISLSAAYTGQQFTITITGYLNYVNDMIVKDNVEIDDAAREQLLQEFSEQGLDEKNLAKIKTYGKYINSDKGTVKGVNVSASYNLTPDLNLTANYSYTYARTRESGVWRNLDRSIRNSGTVDANYNHTWGIYTLNVNLNGRFQSKTYFPDYEDGPGYGIVNINTSHSFRLKKMLVEPSIGLDNIFNKVDKRIRTSSTYRYHPLLSPGTMLVAGLKLKFN